MRVDQNHAYGCVLARLRSRVSVLKSCVCVCVRVQVSALQHAIERVTGTLLREVRQRKETSSELRSLEERFKGWESECVPLC